MNTSPDDNAIPFVLAPKERPPIRQTAAEPFDWRFLIELFVHEVKVAIIEAMEWIGQPLSAAELKLILRGSNWSLGTVAYHVRRLAEQGLICVTDERAVRGARETYYYFTPRKAGIDA